MKLNGPVFACDSAALKYSQSKPIEYQMPMNAHHVKLSSVMFALQARAHISFQNPMAFSKGSTSPLACLARRGSLLHAVLFGLQVRSVFLQPPPHLRLHWQQCRSRYPTRMSVRICSPCPKACSAGSTPSPVAGYYSSNIGPLSGEYTRASECPMLHLRGCYLQDQGSTVDCLTLA